MAAHTPFDAAWHLRAHGTRLLGAVGRLLAAQRQRGRTPAADALRGMVIEDGEAEGLLAELAADWAGRAAAAPAGPAGREESELARLTRAAMAAGAWLPLQRAERAFELTPPELDLVLLALLVELDARFGRLVAYLNDHVAHNRPTLGLGLALGVQEHGAAPAAPEVAARPLVRDGLLELEGDGPLPGRALRLPAELVRRLASPVPLAPEAEGVEHRPVVPGLLERLVLAEPVARALEVWAAALRGGRELPPLLLGGDTGSGRGTAAEAAASAAGLALTAVAVKAPELALGLRLARREARWYGGVLLVRLAEEPALEWPRLWRELDGCAAPVMLALPAPAVEPAAAAAPGPVAALQLGEPDPTLRARLWQALLPAGSELAPEVADTLAASYHFNPGRIAQVLRRARSELTLRSPGQRRIDAEVLHAAARAVSRASMGDVAQRLPLPYGPEDLVVPPQVRAELELALAWVRHQRRVLAEWGFERRVAFGQGLKALMSGPPGTGKTMAAQVLARQLGLELYRVDLSQVMSKYIGETEKNLGRVFQESHRSGAVLFFDEADALFGKRSEVKDAHDRYANVEVGYLLQRLEEHDGVVLLATNRRQDMDNAFLRRFDVLVEFPLPGEEDRLRIWQGMFPPAAERDPDLDLARVARRFELSGGEIRNVALAAAYLAASDGSRISLRHLQRALHRELLKSGRVVDEREIVGLGGGVGG